MAIRPPASFHRRPCRGADGHASRVVDPCPRRPISRRIRRNVSCVHWIGSNGELHPERPSQRSELHYEHCATAYARPRLVAAVWAIWWTARDPLQRIERRMIPGEQGVTSTSHSCSP